MSAPPARLLRTEDTFTAVRSREEADSTIALSLHSRQRGKGLENRFGLARLN